ncbi:hypothetical protein DK254_27525 [Pseudomonas sp. RW407]|uniref:hypothetical protein n=1 Tax=Pseudomonas sp. RW407 TaxID=2202894 RepID=UPI000D703088|nr:hypothetical protein [Pseudomonas sp. RW407]PWU26333.1 hypothetical protein DK254_27525 [Pseudomonas sp. RW407]
MNILKAMLGLGFWFFILFASIGSFFKFTFELNDSSFSTFLCFMLFIAALFFLLIPVLAFVLKQIVESKAWDFLGE